MHKARITRDKENNVYLVINDSRLNAAFRIEEFISRPIGKQVSLSIEFMVDLSGKK